EQKHQFMFGPSILVVPITEPGTKQWSLYLPAHKKGWIDFRSGKKWQGGVNVEIPVDLSSIPLFVKAGSIIPMGPVKQFTSQHTDDPVEIRIYPGGDASFTLYEDEGNNYHYEQGQYSTIELQWNDAEATFTVGDRKGAFPGMEQTRSFRLVRVDPVNTTENGKTEKGVTIDYSGKQKSIRLN
ncbi:MAG TPA: glycosyl hydrolase family 31, partial [Porphyromonadaceae bacterium]|nr:glycosyl hydrolase family 31 [Porphyromonadaceae bacterium]